jgi:hypothetical protein
MAVRLATQGAAVNDELHPISGSPATDNRNIILFKM